MPRKDSKAEQVRVVERWVQWKCEAKWQYNIAPHAFDPEVFDHGKPSEFDYLIDPLIAGEDLPSLKQITQAVKALPDHELEKLATAAHRQDPIFHAGRPWEGWTVLLMADVDDLIKQKRRSVRAACEHLATKAKFKARYGGRSPGALRALYYAAKKSERRD